MDQCEMVSKGINAYGKRETAAGHEIMFSKLIKLAETELGKPVSDIVRDPSQRFQDNIRQFWNNHMDGGACQDERTEFNFSETVREYKEQFEYMLGADWTYVPPSNLSPEQVIAIKEEDWWEQYLYYPVLVAIAQGLGDLASGNMRVYYDW